MKENKNILLFYIINFLLACIFLIPIWYFFFVNYLHFGIGNAIMINTISGLVTLVFEIHSGAWADRFGRKKLYIIGLLLYLFGFSFYLWATQIYLFLIAAFFLGIGYACTSGNLEALIHDGLEEKGEGDRFNDILSNNNIIMFTGRAISSLLAGYLYFYNELFPIIASMICYMIAFFLVFFISSPKQELSLENTNVLHLKKAIFHLLKHKRMLYVIVFLGLFFLGLANIYWFTYQAYLEKIGFTIKNIGILYFFISLFSAFGSYIIKKIQTKFSIFIFLQAMFVFLIFISEMFVFFDNFLGLIPIFLLSILFGFVMILGNSYLIKNSPKTHKSTILSIFSFAGSLGYFAFGLTSGYMVQIFSLERVYAFLPFLIGLVFLVSFVFYPSLSSKPSH